MLRCVCVNSARADWVSISCHERLLLRLTSVAQLINLGNCGLYFHHAVLKITGVLSNSRPSGIWTPCTKIPCIHWNFANSPTTLVTILVIGGPKRHLYGDLYTATGVPGRIVLLMYLAIFTNIISLPAFCAIITKMSIPTWLLVSVCIYTFCTHLHNFFAEQCTMPNDTSMLCPVECSVKRERYGQLNFMSQ